MKNVRCRPKESKATTVVGRSCPLFAGSTPFRCEGFGEFGERGHTKRTYKQIIYSGIGAHYLLNPICDPYSKASYGRCGCGYLDSADPRRVARETAKEGRLVSSAFDMSDYLSGRSHSGRMVAMASDHAR